MWKYLLCCMLLLGISGCGVQRQKVKLTMHYPDGQKKVFVGKSVERYSTTGEWSYWKRGAKDRSLFKGRVECEPVLDITPSDDVATMAEDPQGR